MLSHSAITQAWIYGGLTGFPADLRSHKLFRTSAVSQTNGSSLKGSGAEMLKSSFSTFSGVKFGENFSSPIFSQLNTSRDPGHEHRAWLRVSTSLLWHVVQKELSTSRRILFCLSLVGRSWCSSFHKKLMDELDKPFSRAKDQLLVQSCWGSWSLELQSQTWSGS